MKNLFIGIFIILIFLSGCSSKPPSIELISSFVEIRDGVKGEIVYGNETGKQVTYKTLDYQFILKNTGNKDIGGMTKEKGINIKIIPNEKLKQVTNEVMHINIYAEPNSTFEKGVNKRIGVISKLKLNSEGKYEIEYYLGANEKNDYYSVVPSQDKLDELKKYAMDSTLVVLVKDKEIARFDLRNETNIQ